MRISRKALALAAGAVMTVAGSAPVFAQNTIKVGVLNDQSAAFADYQGIGSVIAARMAVEDYGGKAAGKTIEVISADHQNKTDIGMTIARRWYESEGVDAIFDLPNSAIALGVANMTAEKNKAFIASGAGTALLTGEKCTPNTVHWTYDTYAYGHAVAKAVMARGGMSWFFVTADYALATIWKSRRRTKCAPAAARCSAPCAIRSATPITPRSSCRRRIPRRSSSASPTPATIRPIS